MNVSSPIDSGTVLVTNLVDSEVLAYLRAHCWVVANSEPLPWTKQELLARAREATAILAFMTDCIDEPFLSACPKLRIVACALKGYDNFDVDAFTRRGVWLTVVPDLLTVPTAELAIGLMIAAARNIVDGDRFVRSGAFQGWRPIHSGSLIAGNTVGIVGMGALGRALAERLAGFGVRMVYCDPRPLGADAERELRVARLRFDELLSASDIVILAAPLSRATIHLVDAVALTRIKRGAILVNVARGSLVDEEAVAAALDDGTLAAYAADVFEMEDWARPDRPRSVSARLVNSPKAVLTPHLGSAIPSVRREITMQAADSIVQFLQGVRPPPGAVNRPLYAFDLASC
jgi:phosphonate dehydrogenase